MVLTNIDYRVLAELAMYGGEVVPWGQLLHRVWGPANTGDARLVRTIVKNLRRKLDDDAGDPKYLFTEPRMGYWMPVPL